MGSISELLKLCSVSCVELNAKNEVATIKLIREFSHKIDALAQN